MTMSIEALVKDLTINQEQKHEFLLDVLRLTNEQARVIKEADIESLGKITDSKQAVIDKINELDELYHKSFTELKSELGVNDLSEVLGRDIKGMASLKAKTLEIVDTIKQIIKLEEGNNNKMINVLSSLGNEIKKINNIKTVEKAYSSYAAQSAPSYFIDKKK